MAKKKTANKELKIKETPKEEIVEIPFTKLVQVLLIKDNKKYYVGRDLADTLIKQGRAKLCG